MNIYGVITNRICSSSIFYFQLITLLPGKVAPLTAGLIIKNTVLHLLQEHNEAK